MEWTGIFYRKATLTAIDPHMVAAQLEEARDILEGESKRPGLPVCGVVGEEDLALDI